MSFLRPRSRTQVATGLGAISIVTAVGLAGTVAPAEAAEPTDADARPPITGAIPVPRDVPRDRDEQRTYTVRAGDTVTAIAARYGTTVSAIIKANDLGSRAMIQIGQVLVIPGGGSSSSGTSASSGSSTSGGSSSSTTTYTVRSGDTLSGIASRYHTTVARITSLNGLSSTVIFPGQTLRVTGSASTSGSSSSGGSTSSGGSSSTSGSTRYTVRSGDTVSAIAARYDTTVSAIIKANDLGSRALIRIGQVLVIPGSGSSGSSSSGSSSSGSSSSGSASTSGSSSSSTSTYTVRSGDTLSGIAASHGTTVSRLTSLNGLSSSVIFPGQKLTVPAQLVPSTFLSYTYPASTVAAANANKHTLLQADLPSAAEMKDIIRTTAIEMGVDPALALAVAQQESGFSASAVSPANAVGAMQVIPSSGEWASDMVGRDLDLLDPHDNAVAGVAILRWLVRNAADLPSAIAGYYQGLGSVRSNGMYADTRRYVANIQTLMTRYA